MDQLNCFCDSRYSNSDTSTEKFSPAPPGQVQFDNQRQVLV